MGVILNIFLLVLGFFLLVKSADYFVSGSVEIAKRLKISSLVIGLTVVAMGTSAPEAAISVMAAFRGSSDIAIANVVGSNTINMVFVIGLCAMLFPIAVNFKNLARDYWVSVAATILLFIMVYVFDDYIPRFGGIILLLFFISYMIAVVRSAVKNKTPDTEKDTLPPKPLWKSMLIAIVGLIVLVAAGQITVSSAVNIAAAAGMSERIIGLTIVALGTSLPEIVSAVTASRKGEGEMVLGLIIGSNIFNLLLVLGLAGSIVPLTIGYGVQFDIAALTVGVLAFFIFAKTGNKIIRLEGLSLLLMFSAYMFWVILS